MLGWDPRVERRSVQRVAGFAGQATRPALYLHPVLPIDLLEAPLVDLGRLAVERDGAAVQGDDPRAIAPGEGQEMERADDGDPVLLVDLLEVLHHRVARRGVEARHGLVRE